MEFNCDIYKCLKIREFQIQSVVGDHLSSPNMEIKKIWTPPTKIHWKSSVFIVIYGVDDCGK
jgi:hypothetical protein